MSVLQYELRPELKELSGLNNVLLTDIYGNTGTHKDFKAFRMVRIAQFENAGTIVVITSGNEGLSLNNVVRGYSDYSPEVVHIVPEDVSDELKTQLDREPFAKVIEWRRDKFLDKDGVRRLLGRTNFFYPNLDYNAYFDMFLESGVLGGCDAKYIVAPIGTGDLATSLVYARWVQNLHKNGKAILIVPKGEHPLSKDYKEFRRSQSLTDKLVTNYMNEHNRLQIEKSVKEGSSVITEVDNQDIEKAVENGRMQDVDAEPSGLVSLAVLDKDFRRRNNLELDTSDGGINLYITGIYGRSALTIPRLVYGSIIVDDFIRLTAEEAKKLSPEHPYGTIPISILRNRS